jgi:1-pyrroline-5-carboxylate dehydrogenase
VTAFGNFRPPPCSNEGVLGYAPGSAERKELRERLRQLERSREIPLVIGGNEVRTGDIKPVVMPHDHEHVLGEVHQAGPSQVAHAISAARAARADWGSAPWEDRAAVFLRAAELLAGPWRPTLNAATMLGQSKTIQQAEIDAACETIDFWRFNVEFMTRIYEEQPRSGSGTWNRAEYRPLEGFVLAVSPFNFTAIGANLSTAPALMGNTVVWKPAAAQMLSAYWTMRLLQAAGLPDGVINLVPGDGATVVEAALESPQLAGVHFTGSTEVFQGIWKRAAANLDSYNDYPRLVGETGGKDFIVAHASADLAALGAAIVRGSFEYQGQKCSAASRLFVPMSLWGQLRERLAAEIADISTGDVRDFEVFMGAVIGASAFETQREAIAEARAHARTEVLAGGGTDDSRGWFVEPTLIETRDPDFRLLRDELFGPVLTAYVYPDRSYPEVLRLIDEGSRYGLTGAVFADDRAAISMAEEVLRYTAGNMYVNDKPTGAVVGQQPFGGGRASGTNDKAGSMWNLIRWTSPRVFKETFVPPHGWRYPSMVPEDLDASGHSPRGDLGRGRG